MYTPKTSLSSTVKRTVLADGWGVTHWFIASRMPKAGSTGRPECNMGSPDSHFVVCNIFATEATWPTCLQCAGL
jgi:hypothetical protein